METPEGDSGVGKRGGFLKDLQCRDEGACWVEEECQKMKQRNEEEAWLTGPIEAGSEHCESRGRVLDGFWAVVGWLI